MSKKNYVTDYDLERFTRERVDTQIHTLHEAVYYDRSARRDTVYMTQSDRIMERVEALAELLGVEFYTAPAHERRMHARRVGKGKTT